MIMLLSTYRTLFFYLQFIEMKVMPCVTKIMHGQAVSSSHILNERQKPRDRGLPKATPALWRRPKSSSQFILTIARLGSQIHTQLNLHTASHNKQKHYRNDWTGTASSCTSNSSFVTLVERCLLWLTLCNNARMPYLIAYQKLKRFTGFCPPTNWHSRVGHTQTFCGSHAGERGGGGSTRCKHHASYIFTEIKRA